MVRQFAALLIAALAVATAALAASCGGDDGAVQPTAVRPTVTGVQGEVQGAIRQLADRYNAKDVLGVLGFYTDKGLNSQYLLTREEATAIMPDFIGRLPLAIFRFVKTNVTGDTAEVQVLTGAGKVASEDTFSLVRDAGAWKVDGYARLPANNPAGRLYINVSMKEFGFDFDASLIKDGNISFKIKDDGQQRHEIILDRIPAALDLEEAIKGGKPPEAVEPISFLGIAKPGETKRMVFDGVLEPGRYVFLCFMPDADDPAHTPHALKGMHAEFTVK